VQVADEWDGAGGPRPARGRRPIPFNASAPLTATSSAAISHHAQKSSLFGAARGAAPETPPPSGAGQVLHNSFLRGPLEAR
jgi:hypothetical protein